MNEEAQKELNRILTKSPDELTEDEKGFLRARRSYLKDSHKEEYKKALEVKEEKKEEKEEEAKEDTKPSEEPKTVKKDGKPQTTN